MLLFEAIATTGIRPEMTQNKIEFIQGADFTASLKKLYQKGGQYQKAGERVFQAWGKARIGESTFASVFDGLTLTTRGESRIMHCRKFDLTGYARLVTAYSNNLCIFLFAGDHETVDNWLDTNKGLDFIAREQDGGFSVAPVYVSDRQEGRKGLVHSEIDWMSSGPVIDQLPGRYRTRLLVGLNEEVLTHIHHVESDTSEDFILEIASKIEHQNQADAVLDVLLALRSGDLVRAKSRIDLMDNEARKVETLTNAETEKIVSGDATVRVQDIDPILFEHFVKTADFKQWMLYLHPRQREFVDRDFPGPTRLAGVSGSGKTCVVIHRALRLARVAPEKQVLVLTLNEALARLIDELIDAECGPARPKNLRVKSVFALCREKLITLDPGKRDYYGKRIVQRNEFAAAEHIDDIWEEYFHCQANNQDADVMFDVVRTLLARGVLPQDYLRQELDYARSAFGPGERDAYLGMDRVGRVIGLEGRYREAVLRGLAGWEKKMAAVGAIDDGGIVTALSPHLEALQPEFDHVLVDEVQDLGTLELRIVRRLTREGENDLFLCGDAAQTVHTKYLHMKDAGVDLPSQRWIRLNQNYRNSRQILTAAYEVLTRSFGKIPTGTVDLEILQPEFANFSSAKPLLLRARSISEELSFALAYARDNLQGMPSHKICIAVCGYSQPAIEQMATSLGLSALCGTTDVSAQSLFVSDLEQTKGFEFDLMIVLNCRDGVIPHPNLPEHESYRELCKLYVALTRAKKELVVSYHSTLSNFIASAEDCFNPASWYEHGNQGGDLTAFVWPSPSLRQVGNISNWSVSGKEFLRMREAVGLTASAQDQILQRVTGIVRTEARAGGGGRTKQIEWKEFGSFFQDMESPLSRAGILSNEAWDELKARLESQIMTHGPDSVGAEQATASAGNATNASSPATVGTGPSPRMMLFRHEDVLTFPEQQRRAHILASMCVAQGVSGAIELGMARPMPYPILSFLIPRQEIATWLQTQYLRVMRNDPNAMALTKAGLDECKRLLENFTLVQQVSDCKDMILSGQARDAKVHFYERSFPLLIATNVAQAKSFEAAEGDK